MENKLETSIPTLENVPEEAQTPFLPNSALSSLVQASHNMYAKFQPLMDVNKLLYSVTQSDRSAFHKVLKKDFNLVFKMFSVTNLSGQAFENINMRDYLLGTLDEPMLEILISHIPDNWGAQFLAGLVSQYKTSRLLYHVVRGNHDAVRALLEEDIDLVLQEGIVIDCSGRLFRRISALQYAFWAFDEHMWKTLWDCVKLSEKRAELEPKCFAVYQAFCPEEHVAEDKGERAASQPVSFELNGKPITAFHYDFAVINALQEQAELQDAPWSKAWEVTIDTQWKKGVGGAQRLLPMHVVNEYCFPHRPFTNPDFTINPGSSRQFYNYNTKNPEDWFSVASKLGEDFGICRGPYPAVATPRLLRARDSRVVMDFTALTALLEARKEAFTNLKTQFIESMMAENQPPTVHTM